MAIIKFSGTYWSSLSAMLNGYIEVHMYLSILDSSEINDFLLGPREDTDVDMLVNIIAAQNSVTETLQREREYNYRVCIRSLSSFKKR